MLLNFLSLLSVTADLGNCDWNLFIVIDWDPGNRPNIWETMHGFIKFTPESKAEAL